MGDADSTGNCSRDQSSNQCYRSCEWGMQTGCKTVCGPDHLVSDSGGQSPILP